MSIEPATFFRGIVAPSLGHKAVIDLRGVRWVQPYGLVALAVFAENQMRLRREIEVLAPRIATVSRYMDRMGFGDVIRAMGGTHNLLPSPRYDHGNDLLELQKFASEEAADALAALVYEKLVGSDADLASAMYQSIIELGQNVSQHSGRPSGFAAVASTHGGSRIAFAIGDSGKGMLASLESFNFTDDEDALESVMLGGISSTGDAGRGQGLRTARELLTGRGGVLVAQSGVALRFETQTGGHPIRHPTAHVQGTILQGLVDC